MRTVRRATCLWPGLTQLWHLGSVTALLVATTFTLLFNFAFLITWTWTEAVSPGFRIALWTVLTVWWSAAAIASYYWTVAHDVDAPDNRDDEHYKQAIREYLRQNWLRAETLLEQLIKRNPRDVDVHVTLVGLLRRTGRIEEAVARLDRIRRLEGWQKWDLEIKREQSQLERLQTEQNPTTNQSPSESETELPQNTAAWIHAA